MLATAKTGGPQIPRFWQACLGLYADPAFE